MNFSFILGILIGAGSIFWAIFMDSSSLKVFLNIHAIVIVFACTLGVAITCFGVKHVFSIFMIVVKIITGHNKRVRLRTIGEILSVVKQKRDGKAISEIIPNVSHPFFIDSLTVLERDLLSAEEMKGVMFKRIQSQHRSYEEDYKTFKIISRFPPAFGLIGATLGMINLLQGLGGANAFDNIGPAMSSALTATFWGLILANIFLIPIGENLEISSDEDIKLRQIIADGVMMIFDKDHPLLVQEKLKSHLAPSEYKVFDEICKRDS